MRASKSRKIAAKELRVANYKRKKEKRKAISKANKEAKKEAEKSA